MLKSRRFDINNLWKKSHVPADPLAGEFSFGRPGRITLTDARDVDL
jgi:hypothetical protein